MVQSRYFELLKPGALQRPAPFHCKNNKFYFSMHDYKRHLHQVLLGNDITLYLF